MIDSIDRRDLGDGRDERERSRLPRPSCPSRQQRSPFPFAKARRAFTIVELLIVIGIIGILLGIVTTAATSSVKNARVRRGEAMASALQQAISAYYAQEGHWPGAIESQTEKMGNKSKYTFSGAEADSILQEIVRKSVGASASRPLVDASALFVADSSRVRNNGCFDNHSARELSSYCGGA